MMDIVNSPTQLALLSSEFETPANPNMAYIEGGLRTEMLVVPGLEEYQSYVFTVRVWTSEGDGPEGENEVCERTQEAGGCGLCVSNSLLNIRVHSNEMAYICIVLLLTYQYIHVCILLKYLCRTSGTCTTICIC